MRILVPLRFTFLAQWEGKGRRWGLSVFGMGENGAGVELVVPWLSI